MKHDSWYRRLLKRSERVYVFPTRMGGYLNGLIFLMFLLAVGYSSNLLLIFTLFLFGFNLLWVVQTHSNLNKLKIIQMEFPDGHAHESVVLSLRLNEEFRKLKKLTLRLEGPDAISDIRPLDEEGERFRGEMILPRRGKLRWTHLRLSTELPFGLYQVWKYVPLKGTSHVYPALLKDVGLPPELQLRPGEDSEKDGPGHEGFRELVPYYAHEARRISWKHFARSGELLAKTGEDTVTRIMEVKLALPAEAEARENYLSLTATQMVICHRQQIPFSFTAPGLKVGPTLQNTHLQECLKVLGLC
jgi:uncharacterized protein (DUF58 family)